MKLKPTTLLAVALLLLGLWLQFGRGEPGPGPEPEPEPEPKPVVEKLWVVFLYESDDIDDDAWFGNIRNSQKIRRLASDTLVLKFADLDEKDQDNQPSPSVKPWIEHVKKEGLKLPHILLIDQDGNLVHNTPCPRSVDDTVGRIKGYAP